MTVHCCSAMDSQCRTYWKDQPEEEKSDACVEWSNGIYAVADNRGRFFNVIRYCPWCGAQLFGDRHSTRGAVVSN